MDETKGTLDHRLLEIADDLDQKLAYVSGQRDGLIQMVTMVLCALIVVTLIRRIYGPEN